MNSTQTPAAWISPTTILGALVLLGGCFLLTPASAQIGRGGTGTAGQTLALADPGQGIGASGLFRGKPGTASVSYSLALAV